MQNDVGLLAIQAAEELTRFKSDKNTSFSSLNKISILIKAQESLNEHYEVAYLCNDAIESSADPDVSELSITQIIQEASEFISSSAVLERDYGHAVDPLIHFFVALSDSAALYQEKLRINSSFVLQN